MADATMTGNSILAGGTEHVRDSDRLEAKIKTGLTTAKVGFALTGTGETAPDVDIHDGATNNFQGLLQKAIKRPSNTYVITDALAAETDIKVLKPSGGRYLVKFLLDGANTPVAGKKGDPVYSDGTGLTVTNHSPGSLCIGAVTNKDTKVGTLAEDITTGDSTSDANGKIALMWY